MDDETAEVPSPPEVPDGWEDDAYDDPAGPGADEPGSVRPVNWNPLTVYELDQEWLVLNRWVNWLRHTYALPASVIPPYWHRHPELRWELSALHLHWLCAYAYAPDEDGSAPLGWHRDFAAARQRLRDWVAASGTRHDPPPRHGPGAHPQLPDRGRAAARAHLDDCLALVGDAHAIYMSVDDSLRRIANQSFFERLTVADDNCIDGEPGTPFNILFDQDVPATALAAQAALTESRRLKREMSLV